MADVRLRDLERRARSTGAWEDVLAVRVERKRVGLSAGLDLSLPHVWDVVRSNRPYAQVLGMLRAVCGADVKESGLHPFEESVVRPLTFKENIQARIAQYAAAGRAGSLWTSWLDSCSAIVYKKGTTKFKIVPLSAHLLKLPASFRNVFLEVNYADFDGPELDAQDDVYNQDLTQEQVVEHEGWLAAVEGDEALLKEYAGLVFGLLRRDTAMRFWIVSNPAKDQLLPLAVYSLGGNSNCNGGRSLDNDGRFVRVCPP